MEKLIVLGTGNATATKCFNTCFVIQNETENFLVDTGGGNGILSALEKVNIAYDKLHHIFITHGHTDHLLGIVWLIRVIGTAMNKNKYDGNCYIYCHSGLVDAIQTIVRLTVQEKFYKYMNDRILFVPLEDGDCRQVAGYDVTFFDICSTKAKQYGFTMQLHNGRKLTCMGDEPYREEAYAYANGADWLLHEAFCLYSERDVFKPYEKYHSTVREACELAEALHVKNLVLWHTEDSNMAERKARYTAEGKQYYDGNLYVPEDLEILEL